MAGNSLSSGSNSFRLFDSADDKPDPGGLGFTGFGGKSPPPPPPPCLEVLPSEVSTSVKYTVEQISVADLTLLKGRVSTQEVFALPNSDLVPGQYEGGLKLWEGSLDLIKALNSEIQNGKLSFEGKSVLELGCGHGLPGIFACLKGASAVHLQDFNAEVLRCLTIPNVNENLSKPSQASNFDKMGSTIGAEVRFFAGDWCDVKNVLPRACAVENLQMPSEGGSRGGYDVILMAETIYSVTTLPILYNLIKECINHSGGAVYVAAKKHYFGVGGGTRRFLSIVEKDGVLASTLVAEVADGSSNVREVWKLYCKES